MTFYEFVQWCFRNENSTIVTLLILGGFFPGVIGVINALKSDKRKKKS
jgi:hypothetical protein